MEGKFKKGKEVLVEKLELPKDVILDIPKIIVMGRNEITIENHKGIQIFEKNKIISFFLLTILKINNYKIIN